MFWKILTSIETSKLRYDAKITDLKNQYSGRVNKKATILSKIEKMVENKQVDLWKKPDKENVVIAEILFMFYRSLEMKGRFKLLKAMIESIRHTSYN